MQFYSTAPYNQWGKYYHSYFMDKKPDAELLALGYIINYKAKSVQVTGLCVETG